MRALVTDAKSRMCYAALRSLYNHGIEVTTSDFVQTAMSFYSRYSSSKFVYPSPYQYPEKFIDALLNRLKYNKYDFLLPVYEETFLISKHKEYISKYTNIVIPDYENVLTVHDKKRLYELCTKCKIKYPNTYSLVDIMEDHALIEKLKFPVLIKPRQGGGAWGIQRIDNADILSNMIAGNKLPFGLENERFLVQEIVHGYVACCALLFNKGKYRAGHCYRQLREVPITGGTATYRKSIISADLISNLSALMTSLEWHGVCHADFIVDSEGTPYLIDVNPRLWGSIFQAIISGVDFPYLLYRIAVDGDCDSVCTYNVDLNSRWIGGDTKWLYYYIKDHYCPNV